MNNNLVAQEWFRYAKQDLDSAIYLQEMQPVPVEKCRASTGIFKGKDKDGHKEIGSNLAVGSGFISFVAL